MSEDVTIKVNGQNVVFEKDMSYRTIMETIQHDPVQFPSPKEFKPERFDFKTPDNKWVKTSEGKLRNSLAFTPFYGGKRICLGKTFAETNVKFTIPIIMYHLDF